ncbi:exosome complex component RRP45 [Agrilus planipennis]|uniref:Exosome complex component RRP45 n=1 Tax=Agrilus planipennis TaxID=224129 RepID=A0A7F5RL26_AGRPL|nr:exosome complex component RRP45 [Agrilus planipennis]
MAKVRESPVATCEKNFLLKALSNYTRLDGRAFDEFRNIKIQFGKDWGCCYVALGQTCALAQVSSEIQQPNSARPSEGIININVELNPMAAAHFEPGRQTDMSVQINRILEKCIKDSKAVDLESLCIKVNEKVWLFRVDVNILSHEGNIVDCASIAAIAALAHYRRPDVTSDGEEIIVHTYSQRDPVPTVLHHHPICVSYAVFNEGEVLLADPTLLEENVAEAHLNIGLNAYKELCTLHLGGSTTLNQHCVIQYTEKAAKRAAEVIDFIKKSLEEDTVKRDQDEVADFSSTLFSEIQEDTVNALIGTLNTWTTQENKWKKPKQLSNIEIVENDNSVIEVVGEKAAALVPRGKDESDVWICIDEDVDDDCILIES